ncbi:3532_t:CDS:2 [Cetraspora pellucida]|uniref:3532_t:CDS:1 n=1 Tax=Cetraspora pellucida TaxID=1433469 RepID=A0A9N9EZ06_9GLOM|nr:3532_t:CDS:2 [Cetraspora pellucida]
MNTYSSINTSIQTCVVKKSGPTFTQTIDCLTQLPASLLCPDPTQDPSEFCGPQTTTLCVIESFGPTFTQTIDCLTDTTTSLLCSAPTHFPSDCSNYDTTTIFTCTPTTLVCSPTEN